MLLRGGDEAGKKGARERETRKEGSERKRDKERGAQGKGRKGATSGDNAACCAGAWRWCVATCPRPPIQLNLMAITVIDKARKR